MALACNGGPAAPAACAGAAARQQMMLRQRQLALERQRNATRKPFGVIAQANNDVPAFTPGLQKMPGWGRIIEVGLDKPGCLAEAQQKQTGNSLVVSKPQEEVAAKQSPGEPDKVDDGIEECTLSNPEPAPIPDSDPRMTWSTGKAVGEPAMPSPSQKKDKGGWDLEIEEVKETIVPDVVQESKGNKKWWKPDSFKPPWKKETKPAASPSAAAKSSTNSADAVTAIASFDDDVAIKRSDSSDDGIPTLPDAGAPAPKAEPRRQPRASPARQPEPAQATVTSVTAISSLSPQGGAEEARPTFSKPRHFQEPLPGCPMLEEDEEDDLIMVD